MLAAGREAEPEGVPCLSDRGQLGVGGIGWRMMGSKCNMARATEVLRRRGTAQTHIESITRLRGELHARQSKKNGS